MLKKPYHHRGNNLVKQVSHAENNCPAVSPDGVSLILHEQLFILMEYLFLSLSIILKETSVDSARQ